MPLVPLSLAGGRFAFFARSRWSFSFFIRTKSSFRQFSTQIFPTSFDPGQRKSALNDSDIDLDTEFIGEDAYEDEDEDEDEDDEAMEEEMEAFHKGIGIEDAFRASIDPMALRNKVREGRQNHNDEYDDFLDVLEKSNEDDNEMLSKQSLNPHASNTLLFREMRNDFLYAFGMPRLSLEQAQGRMGSYTDVYKNCVLTGLLDHFSRQESPFTYTCVFAGGPRYDVSGSYTRGTGVNAAFEVGRAMALKGLENPRYWRQHPFSQYLRRVREINNWTHDTTQQVYPLSAEQAFTPAADDEQAMRKRLIKMPKLQRHFRYIPGNAAMVRPYMRSHDRAVLIEDDDEYVRQLEDFVGNDRRFKIVHANQLYRGEEPEALITDEQAEAMLAEHHAGGSVPQHIVREIYHLYRQRAQARKRAMETYDIIFGTSCGRSLNADNQPSMKVDFSKDLDKINRQISKLEERKSLLDDAEQKILSELCYLRQAIESSSEQIEAANAGLDDEHRSELNQIPNLVEFANGVRMLERDPDLNAEQRENVSKMSALISRPEIAAAIAAHKRRQAIKAEVDSLDLDVIAAHEAEQEKRLSGTELDLLPMLPNELAELQSDMTEAEFIEFLQRGKQQLDALTAVSQELGEALRFRDKFAVRRVLTTQLARTDLNAEDRKLLEELDCNVYPRLADLSVQMQHADSPAETQMLDEIRRFLETMELGQVLMRPDAPVVGQTNDVIKAFAKPLTTNSLVHIDIGIRDSIDSMQNVVDRVGQEILPIMAKRYPHSTFLVTYPIFGKAYQDELLSDVMKTGFTSVLHGYFFPRHALPRFATDVFGCGAIIINPPVNFDMHLDYLNYFLDIAVDETTDFETKHVEKMHDMFLQHDRTGELDLKRAAAYPDTTSVAYQMAARFLDDYWYRPGRRSIAWLSYKEPTIRQPDPERLQVHYDLPDYTAKFRKATARERRRIRSLRNRHIVGPKRVGDELAAYLLQPSSFRDMNGLPFMTEWRRRTRSELLKAALARMANRPRIPTRFATSNDDNADHVHFNQQSTSAAGASELASKHAQKVIMAAEIARAN